MKKRNHKGIRNPHWGHIMSDASRKAISASQKARFEFYKKAAANIMTEDRVREIINETVKDYLTKKANDNNNKKIDIRL
jgi:hypothetical protein